MKTTALLDAIIFDPLSWMHPGRMVLAPVFDGARARSVINDIIIAAREWSTERPALPLQGLALEFVGQWHALPQVAFLLACQRHRAQLARQGKLLTLPAWARCFAQTALVDSSAALSPANAMPDTLLAWGKCELDACAQLLPLVIRQRISLLFSPDMDRGIQACHGPLPNPLLIKLAFQHAKRHTATPDAAHFRRYLDQTRAVVKTTPGG